MSRAKRPRVDIQVQPGRRNEGASASRSAEAAGERERILYVLDNVPDEVILDTLKAAVSKSNSKLPSLATIFNKKKFPPKPQILLQCLRCRENFDPAYNTDSSCKVPHPDWDTTHKTRYGYEWECTSCGKTWTTDGLDDIIESDPEISFCYVGPHTLELSDSDSD